MSIEPRNPDSGLRSQVGIDHTDDTQIRRDMLGDLIHPRYLLSKLIPETDPIDLVILLNLMDGLDHRLDTHRYFFIRLIPPDQEPETLVPRLSPRIEKRVDQVGRGEFDVIDHTVWLGLERDGGRLAFRADPRRPRGMSGRWTRDGDAIVERGEGR